MRIFTICFTCFIAGTSHAAVISDSSISGDTVIDFEGLSTGSVVGPISQTGATFGEAFVGQAVSGTLFDILTGTPTAPLTLSTASVASDNIGILLFNESNLIYGDFSGSVGEGALSILLDTTTDVFGFDVVGANGGTFTADFFGIGGSLLGSITQTATDSFFGFRSTTSDILGISITNDDGGGIGFDTFTFNTDVAPVPLPAGLPLLLAGLGGLAALRRNS